MVTIVEIPDHPWETISKRRNIETIGEIPKIIHFFQKLFLTRKDKDIIQQWKRTNPDWLCVIWRETDIIPYIQTFHKEYETTFQTFKFNYLKLDLLRPFILYDFGGVCTSISENIITLENELREDDSLVTISERNLKSFLISTPKHPSLKQYWEEWARKPWDTNLGRIRLPIRYMVSQTGGDESVMGIHEGWIIGAFIMLMLAFYWMRRNQMNSVKSMKMEK